MNPPSPHRPSGGVRMSLSAHLVLQESSARAGRGQAELVASWFGSQHFSSQIRLLPPGGFATSSLPRSHFYSGVRRGRQLPPGVTIAGVRCCSAAAVVALGHLLGSRRHGCETRYSAPG